LVVALSFRNVAESIPIEKLAAVSVKLADIVLSSKNDDKMPNELANTILHYWQRNLLAAEQGLEALLEAASLLDPEKAIVSLNELGLADAAERVKQVTAKA